MNLTLNKLSACLFVATALLLLPVQACKKAAPAEDEKPTVSVEAVHPETGDISEDISADAVLTPVAQAAIAAKVSAPIRKFYVQRGSKVAEGQLLATLENNDLAAAALDNKGSYTAAQGAYTVATQSTLPEDLTKARLDLEQAKATFALNKSIFDARSQLLQQGAIPGRDVDTARATMMQSQAALDIAQQHYDALQKGSNKASLESAQGQLDSARGKFLQAQAQLSYTSLHSPIQGVVTDRPLFAGDTAMAGTPIVTVMDTSSLIAKLHLSQAQAQQLQLGAAATFEVPGLDEPVPARVSLISPALDPGSTTVEIWLKVDNAKGRLKPGTTVRVTIKGRTVHNALIVPTEAIQRSSEGGGKIVMVVGADGTTKKKDVTVGLQTKEKTQILAGLSASDTVVTAGSFGLDDGSKVKIEAAKPEGAEDKDAKPEPGEKD